MGLVVAVDGPAASGKGTIARALAARFGMGYLDTGLLYRAVGLKALAACGLDPETAAKVAQGLVPADLEARDIRGAMAAQAASKVAAIGAVRAALIEFQRDFAARAEGAVLDGRDIGTVICPEAAVKLFITADLETRAARRLADLTAKGEATTLEAVHADLAERDARDAGRKDAPLKQAADAHLLDTTDMTIEQAIARAAAIVAPHRG